MSDSFQTISVGAKGDDRQIALTTQSGTGTAIMYLHGLGTGRNGTKARFFADVAQKLDRPFVRWDYSGHGDSTGLYEDGTVSRWLDEAEAVFLATCNGPTILVGSSIGCWVALLLNERLRARGDNRIRGLLLIAPAVDVCGEVLLPSFTDEELVEYERDDRVTRDTGDPTPSVYPRKLIEDGITHSSMFGSVIETGCPVHIIHGAADDLVPVSLAEKLVSHLVNDPVTFTLVPEGDHSLFRPQDLEFHERALTNLIAQTD